MAILYNREGQQVEIPDDQVLSALASGKFGLPQGQTVPMVSPTGKVFDASIDDALAITQQEQGWQFEGAEARRKRETQEKYGATFGQEVAAGLMGVGRAATFGAIDIPAAAILGKERVAGWKEASPAASLGGEMIGIVGSLGLGGVGAVGKGMKAIKTLTGAPRAAARAGLATERAVGNLVKPLAAKGAAGRIGAKALAVGAGTTVEGALYGAGQFVSETALSEEDMGDPGEVAENLIGHVGLGAVLSGGFGVGLGGGFKALGELGKGVGRFTSKTGGAAIKMWENKTGSKALPALKKLFVRGSDLVTGRGDEIEALLQKEILAQATQDVVKITPELAKNLKKAGWVGKIPKTMDIRDVGTMEFTMLQNEMDEFAQQIIQKGTGQTKKSVMLDIASNGNQDATIRHFLGDLTETGYVGGTMDNILDNLNNMMRVGRGEFEGRAQIRKLIEIGEITKGNMIKATALKGKQAAGAIFNQVDDFKRMVGKLDDALRNSYEKTRMSNTANTIDELSAIYKQVQEPLMNPNLFGKQAATMQQEVNRLWTTYLERNKHIPAYRFARRMGTKDFGEVAAAEGKYIYTGEHRGYKGLINDLGRPESQLDQEWILSQGQKKQALLEGIAKHYDDVDPALLQGYTKARKSFESKLSEMESVVGLQNQMKSLEEATRMTGFSATSGAIGGGLIAGPIGAIAGGAIGAIMDPARTLRQLATINRMASGYREKIGTAIKGYVSRFKKAPGKVRRLPKARRMIAPAAVNALMTTNFAPGKKQEKPKDRVAAFNQRMDELREITDNPQAAIDKLSKSTETLHVVAPKVAAQVQAKAVQAAQYALSKAPRDPGMPRVFGKPWKPSSLELTKFERVLAAVANPEVLLKDLENGFLAHETVDAVKNVYPEKFKQIQMALMEHVEEIRETLPYKHCVQWSILFQVPMHETMERDFIAAMQASQIRPEIDPSRPPRQPAEGPVDPMRHMTTSQRLAAKSQLA